jgi:hypothetical protein
MKYFQLGRFQDALGRFQEGLNCFKSIDIETRAQHTATEQQFLIGIVACFEFEMRYREAYEFTTATLERFEFSTDPSDARLSLELLRESLEPMLPLTEGFVDAEALGPLVKKLMEEIQHCETAQRTRILRETIRQNVGTHDFTRHITTLATNIEKTFTEEIRILQERQPLTDIAHTPSPGPTAEQLAALSPDERAMVGEQYRQIEETYKRTQQMGQAFDAVFNRLSETAIGILRGTIKRVRAMAEEPYRIPMRHRLTWVWYFVLRNALQLAAITYLLDTIIDGVAKDGITNLLQARVWWNTKTFRSGLIAVLIFGLGKLADRKIDDALLPRYKRALARFLTDRTNALWVRYNGLLKQAHAAQTALEDLRKKPQDDQGHTAANPI